MDVGTSVSLTRPGQKARREILIRPLNNGQILLSVAIARPQFYSKYPHSLLSPRSRLSLKMFKRFHHRTARWRKLYRALPRLTYTLSQFLGFASNTVLKIDRERRTTTGVRALPFFNVTVLRHPSFQE